jgi:hypothetical protein
MADILVKVKTLAGATHEIRLPAQARTRRGAAPTTPRACRVARARARAARRVGASGDENRHEGITAADRCVRERPRRLSCERRRRRARRPGVPPS